MTTASQGSTGNVIAAVLSFFLPGLGQLCQGRLLTAFVHFAVDVLLWLVMLGWIMHLWSAFSAATYSKH
ncbi:MAG: hypothetical protein AB8G99_15445 [Planctomycetaceae bacterium]